MLKALLRNSHTGMFYAQEDRWTLQPGDAHNFELGSRAIQYAIDRRLPNTELVMTFPDPQWNVVVPIGSPV
jgi:hypothetical protein